MTVTPDNLRLNSICIVLTTLQRHNMTFTPDNLRRNSISIVLTTLQRHFFTVQS